MCDHLNSHDSYQTQLKSREYLKTLTKGIRLNHRTTANPHSQRPRLDGIPHCKPNSLLFTLIQPNISIERVQIRVLDNFY